jgi:hypothetical protein
MTARSAEIFAIRIEHLRLEKGRLVFNVGHSKTDKTGYESSVSVSVDPYSPGAFVLEFLAMIRLEPGNTGFLSRGRFFCREPAKLRSRQG